MLTFYLDLIPTRTCKLLLLVALDKELNKVLPVVGFYALFLCLWDYKITTDVIQTLKS